MNNITFTVFGIPQPKQSARFYAVKKGNKAFVKSYQKESVIQNERNFAFDVKNQLPDGFKPFAGAVRVDVLFVFPPLKSFSKSKINALKENEIIYKTTKPDLQDNLMKGVIDAIEGIVFLNDSQICEVYSKKIYGLIPRIEMTFKEM